MTESAGNRIHPAIVFGLCGAATGVFSWLTTFYDIELFSYALGAVFGAAIAASIRYLFGISNAGMLIIIAMFGISWQTAHRFSIHFYQGQESMVLIGASAGAIGASILAICFAMLFRNYRSMRRVLGTILVGALLGTILNTESNYSMFALFVLWQSGVAVSLGYDRQVFEN